MCESVAGRWDLGRTSHLSAPAVQFCAQGLLSAVLLCGCNTVAIASVDGGSRSSGSGVLCVVSGVLQVSQLDHERGP